MKSFPPLSQATNEELLVEWNYWNSMIQNASSWGAALAAANEFRQDVEQVMKRRGMAHPDGGAW